MIDEKKDRAEIVRLAGEFCRNHRQPAPFVPGKTPVPCGGRVFDAAEMESLVGAALDFWLTAGPNAGAFEKKCAASLGVKHAFFVNSGSSALLLAVTALTDRTLGDRRLAPGDEVVTTAMAFPTTVSPIVLAGAVPVFVDVELPSYNATLDAVRAAITKRTKAIVLAHTLGNPFDAAGIADVAKEKGLWLIEDNCDAMGSLLGGRLTGTFGDLSTLSFYASHHLTTGEGGMVLTQSGELAAIVRSLRDWGRDCVCPTGKDNTCGHRHSGSFGTLPAGYDHKYVYARLGFNLKATDLQAAIGLAQLEKVEAFTAARRENFARLRRGLDCLSGKLLLPEAAPESDPSWFGFPITVDGSSGVTRDEIVAALEMKKIATRMFFAGNLTRHPAFEGVAHRVATDLAVTDRIMRDSFWIGVYPGITEAMCDTMIASLLEAVGS